MTDYVYAILSCERVKIGHSIEPRRRIHDINSHSPFRAELIGFAEGGRDAEAALHELYSDFQIHNEWFAYVGPVKVWADTLGFADVPKLLPVVQSEAADLKARRKELKTIVKALGGTSSIMKLFNCSNSAIYTAINRGHLPPHWFLKLREFGAIVGVDIPDHIFVKPEFKPKSPKAPI